MSCKIKQLGGFYNTFYFIIYFTNQTYIHFRCFYSIDDSVSVFLITDEDDVISSKASSNKKLLHDVEEFDFGPGDRLVFTE